MQTSLKDGRAYVRWIRALHECLTEGREVVLFNDQARQYELFNRRMT